MESRLAGAGVSEQFLAQNVQPTWTRSLKAAEESAWVLTPYLDDLLVRLLRNADESVDVVVVTDLSPESGPANYRKKLLALKKLIDEGIDVRTLPRLHAKLLVIDGAALVAGSQNFTSYAQKSKEVSAVSYVEPTRAIATIADWVESAHPVDGELVDRLLADTGELAKAVDKAIVELQRQVAETVGVIEAERAERERQEAQRAREESERQAAFDRAARALRRRVSKTPWRLAMGAAHLVPDTATTYSEWSGEDEYPTMFGTDSWGDRSGVDLTRWFRASGAKRETVDLKHLHFYPVIHLPAGRMVLARIAKTRITYIKHSVRFTAAQMIGGERRYLGLALPNELVDGANMVIRVRPWADSAVEHQVGIQFDGDGYDVRWEKAGAGPGASFADAQAEIVVAELMKPRRGPRLVQQLLEPVKFTELGRDNKNAAAFFAHKEHELKLIDYGSARLFVAVQR